MPLLYLFVVCCLLFVVCCLLFVVCCLLFVVCCLLFVVCCLLFVVCCLLFVVCCLLFVLFFCCLLFCCFVVLLIASIHLLRLLMQQRKIMPHNPQEPREGRCLCHAKYQGSAGPEGHLQPRKAHPDHGRQLPVGRRERIEEEGGYDVLQNGCPLPRRPHRRQKGKTLIVFFGANIRTFFKTFSKCNRQGKKKDNRTQAEGSTSLLELSFPRLSLSFFFSSFG